MKISLLTCFILFSLIAFSQEIPPDLLKKMEKAGQQKSLDDSLNRYDLTAEKGKITFTNGETRDSSP
jgi:negative regulator of sigma E activity